MRLLAVPAALLLTLAAPAARAVTITVSFAGTIDEVGSEIASAFTAGDAFTGTLQIDASTADSSADPGIGAYPGAVDDLAFTFGTYLATTTFGQVNVTNGSFDAFVGTTFNASGDPVAGLQLVEATLNLVDLDGSVFSSDAIPTSLSLSDFGFARAFLWFEGGLTSRRVAGNVTSLTFTVPEPGALTLLAVAALGAVLTPRRCRRSR